VVRDRKVDHRIEAAVRAAVVDDQDGKARSERAFDDGTERLPVVVDRDDEQGLR